MKNYTVRFYSDEDFDLWNNFVTKANNATFLFHRDFMEYHKDRFDDFSMLVFCGEDLVSVIPANRVGDEVFSHQGLTYGGLIIDQFVTAEVFEAILKVVFSFLKQKHKTTFVVKEFPHFYNAQKETFDVQKSLLNFSSILKKNTLLVLDFKSDYTIAKAKQKQYKRLQQNNLVVKEENSFDSFWNLVLIPLLKEKYATQPVHSLAEITYLHAKFPKNIEQYNVYLEEEIVAGITIFKTPNVVKSQYGAVTETGKKLRALDGLFVYLIDKFSKTHAFFDMGTVDDTSENGINQGLLTQKLELGCKVNYQNIYQIEL